MDNSMKDYLSEKAREIRIGIIEAVHAAKSGHPGGSLSIADILAYLYFKEMNIDPAEPKMADGTGSSFRKVTRRPRCTACFRSGDTFPARTF